jgi:hypothetical protein
MLVVPEHCLSPEAHVPAQAPFTQVPAAHATDAMKWPSAPQVCTPPWAQRLVWPPHSPHVPLPTQKGLAEGHGTAVPQLPLVLQVCTPASVHCFKSAVQTPPSGALPSGAALSGVPTSAAPTSAAPTSAAPTSAAPTSAAPTSDWPTVQVSSARSPDSIASGARTSGPVAVDWSGVGGEDASSPAAPPVASESSAASRGVGTSVSPASSAHPALSAVTRSKGSRAFQLITALEPPLDEESRARGSEARCYSEPRATSMLGRMTGRKHEHDSRGEQRAAGNH